MTGKIFPESVNVYQDEAKVLFNYYRQAAEKVVAEEERIEKEIQKLEAEKKKLEQDRSKLWYWFLTIILFFVYFIKKSGIDKELAAIDARIAEFKKLHKEIFRGYKVNKMGVAYVPVADRVKYEGKSFVVDYTGQVPESEVKIQVSRQNDLLVNTIGDLANLSSEAPLVESSDDTETIDTDEFSTSIQQVNQHDYFGKLERSLRTIAFCLDDLDIDSVSLPLVADNSDYLNYLNEYSTTEIPDDAPVVQVFDSQTYAPSINKFQQLNRLKDSLANKSQQFEDVLKGLMATMAQSVQTISAMKLASTDKVIFESNKLLYLLLKSPYNHYSPLLEHDEIERIKNESFDYSESAQGYEPFHLKQSSRVRYNLVTGMWTAEDGSSTTVPFGVHQLYEEIVAPVVHNLMQETRIERLKIYNHIKDQKISYLNKWHQDTDAFYRANRAESSDIINLMQESLREYVAAYNTLISLQRTESAMDESETKNLDATVVQKTDNVAETAAAFAAQSQEFQKVQEQFEEYITRLKDDIDEKASRFGHVEYYDAKLADGYSNEVAVAGSEVEKLDPRRKPLATANPLLAKTVELPPAPKVEEVTFEYLDTNLKDMASQALGTLSRPAAMPPIAPQQPAPEFVDEDGDEKPVDTSDNNADEVESNGFVSDENNEVNPETDSIDDDLTSDENNDSDDYEDNQEELDEEEEEDVDDDDEEEEFDVNEDYEDNQEELDEEDEEDDDDEEEFDIVDFNGKSYAIKAQENENGERELLAYEYVETADGYDLRDISDEEYDALLDYLNSQE